MIILIQIILFWFTSENHRALSRYILETEVENTRCLLSVASSASAFLVVVLDGFADGIVNDESNFRLVNAHSERNCCYYNLYKKVI